MPPPKLGGFAEIDDDGVVDADVEVPKSETPCEDGFVTGSDRFKPNVLGPWDVGVVLFSA